MKKVSLILVAVLMGVSLNSAHAQLGKVLNKAKEAVQPSSSTETAKPTTTTTSQQPQISSPVGGGKSLGASELPNGPKVYVNVATGSNRNDGSKGSPLKDLQTAVDNAPEGAVICIAEGNYLGKLDQGYIDIKKYVSLVGGFSSDFSQRDPVKYRTTIQPFPEQNWTNAVKGYLEIYVRGKRDALILIDGLALDMGLQNRYCLPNPKEELAGTPEGCDMGRMLILDESPKVPTTEGSPHAHQLIHGDVEGKVIIRNCLLANSYHFGIQMGNIGGNWEIYNNVFVSNRMASCEVRSMNKTPGQATVDFHHNTVLFTWCRTKHMEDMGYGFRFMTGINAEVHHNIFGCSNLGALDRSYVDSDKNLEAQRKTSAYNNLFFMNKADLVLPSGGGGWLMVAAKNFEDVNQLVKYEGNREMEDNAKFLAAIDEPYLRGFASITAMSSSSFDRNSAANTYRAAHGMNMQGSEIHRVSMYGNRYRLDKAFDLFGAMDGYGAQIVK